MRSGAQTQLNNLREKKSSIKIPIKKDLMNDLIQKKPAGKFTHREKGNQKDKANSGYFILNPLSCEYSEGSGSENFFQLQKQNTFAVSPQANNQPPNIFDDSNSSPRGEINDHLEIAPVQKPKKSGMYERARTSNQLSFRLPQGRKGKNNMKAKPFTIKLKDTHRYQSNSCESINQKNKRVDFELDSDTSFEDREADHQEEEEECLVDDSPNPSVQQVELPCRIDSPFAAAKQYFTEADLKKKLVLLDTDLAGQKRSKGKYQ